MLVVSQRAQQQTRQHERGIGVALQWAAATGDHSQQQAEEHRAHKGGPIIDQLERQRGQEQELVGAPQRQRLQQAAALVSGLLEHKLHMIMQEQLADLQVDAY